MIVKCNSRHCVVTALLVGAVLVATPRPTPAQEGQNLTYGRTTVRGAERTDAGDWIGTWYYVSRSRKMAVWIRDWRGELQFKLKVQSKGGGRESFTTDWGSRAEYDYLGMPARFGIHFDQFDQQTIAGGWLWELGDEAKGRRETLDFTMYRSGLGRQMVAIVRDFKRDYFGMNAVPVSVELQVWLFTKASRRTVLWEELPF